MRYPTPQGARGKGGIEMDHRARLCHTLNIMPTVRLKLPSCSNYLLFLSSFLCLLNDEALLDESSDLSLFREALQLCLGEYQCLVDSDLKGRRCTYFQGGINSCESLQLGSQTGRNFFVASSATIADVDLLDRYLLAFGCSISLQ